MVLWQLRPIGWDDDADDEQLPPAWQPWYDKAFDFIVRAETSEEARVMADAGAGGENAYDFRTKTTLHPWLDPTQSTCEILPPEGPSIVMRDFHAA